MCFGDQVLGMNPFCRLGILENGAPGFREGIWEENRTVVSQINKPESSVVR